MTDTPLAPLKTLSSIEHPADICRANGWDVGTRLVGDEGAGPMVIEITALGERMMLAKRVRHDGEPVRESSWTLSSREWKRSDESPAATIAGGAVKGAPMLAITPLVKMLAPIRERNAKLWRAQFTPAGETVQHDGNRILDALEAVDAQLVERAASYRATANRLNQDVIDQRLNCDPEEAARYNAYAVAAESTITAVRVSVAFALEPVEGM